MPKDQYMCQLCANHGIFNQPKKGHKQKCPHRACECSLCALNTKRRALDQIERQLKSTGCPSQLQSHQTESSLYPEKISSTNMHSTTEEQSISSFKLPPQPSPVTTSHCILLSSTTAIQPTNSNNATVAVVLPETVPKKPIFTGSAPTPHAEKRGASPNEDLCRKQKKADSSIFHSAEKLAQSG